MRTAIELKGMRFYAYHGVFEQETILGNQFEVNLRMEVDLSTACETDQLEDTVSYAEIYDLIKLEMMIPSKLLEHVAWRIHRKIKERFPQITQIEVRLSKKNPPVEGEVESAEIILCE